MPFLLSSGGNGQEMLLRKSKGCSYLWFSGPNGAFPRRGKIEAAHVKIPGLLEPALGHWLWQCCQILRSLVGWEGALWEAELLLC